MNIKETNNPWFRVKNFSEKHATNCLSSILKYFKSAQLNNLILSNVLKDKIVSITNLSLDSVINEFFKIVAPKMAAWLRAQYEKPKLTPYLLEANTLESQFYVKLDEKTYIIKNLKEDNATCSCYEYGSLELPCRHLFFARKDQN